VVVVGGGGYLGYLEVYVLCRQVVICTVDGVVGLTVDVLEEAFQMAGGVFGTRAVEAVGEEEDEARLAEPFGFRTHQILVNNQLRRVIEVTKLGFPHA
jgi:hypothetical protein